MKLTTTKLIGLLAVLVAIYFGVEFLGGKSKSKSLRTEFVNVDTTAVTKMKIESASKTVEVNKINGSWQVTLENGQSVPADQNTIRQALSALNGLSPSRMATRKKEKWAEYQVDSTGTDVSIYAKDEKMAEIVLGKFGVTGQRAYHTFIRMAEDDEVYVADNFMSFSVPSEVNGYRLKSLAKIKKDSLSAIQFTYPSDSSFRLEKVGDKWQANGLTVDSVKVEKYLRGLSFINSSKFVDETDPMGNPVYKAEYLLNNGESVTIDGYLNDKGLVFNSSKNTTSFFADSAVFKKAFIGFTGLQ